MTSATLKDFPAEAPSCPNAKLYFADVAVTATAKEFAGVYRGKQYHEPDFIAVLDRALEAGVEKVMLTGMSLNDVSFNREIAQSRPKQCSITVGVHPYHATEPENEGSEYMKRLGQTVRDLMGQEPRLIRAFGELGLDYDNLKKASKDVQIRTFRRQLDLFVAEKFDLPLFLHCRAAFDDFVDVLRPYLSHLTRGGLVHSFVGNTQQMRTLTEMGFDVSVNGFSFRDRESIAMVSAIPLERLHIETDAPWGEIPGSSEVAQRYLTNASLLPPKKKRDKFEFGSMVKERNESCTVERVAFIIAGLKGISVEEVAKHAWENSTKMFVLI